MDQTTPTLTAWSVTAYGGPETLAPVTRDMPTPAPTEVLIRIRASAVTRADGMMRAGVPRFARLVIGWSRPRHDLIGTCLSGEVIAVGPDVTRFSVGEEVYGMAGLSFGANASHICLDEAGVLMRKPASLSHEEAAVMGDGATTSFNFLHHIAELRAGERVLIIGAAGSLGTAAVQIAAAMGADVTGTCSARNAGMVASLGANRVIDYTVEDFSKSSERYDVIYDTLGISSFREAKRVLTRSGRYVCPVLNLGLLFAALRTTAFGARKARFSATGMLKPEVHRAMHEKLVDLVEADRFAPVMDRTYPRAELVEAHRYMETGHKRGNVVVV
ncbi:NAD(P)-dependent alcohol dehydrogenase [Maritimibacter sp. UBA3975]|uniref:NAD(P)-dependent alcohol dehydrogenase n=1 Tax=Maritimibacter sp. UBA3975 TaxID=1946833 RepID=UPI000C0B83FC|nr:NAD(P)-dependent alcohol dehydrogenase [Maritimibacter sp. UBA3975]MAM61420.1 alcohol dehydrogenase [Maritimibacter sp.]|tara:strand:- start:39626 stop:40615 length:990 start_codon:yes stop_codon:yes gene_type:complete